MELHPTIDGFRKAIQRERDAGRTAGFVPTMGALHDGHISLIAKSVESCDVTALSIFVNPLQFGPTEDLSKYPRPFEADAAKAEAAGVTHLFAPSVDEMYPVGQLQTNVHVSGVTEMLEGALRPGHFDGVSTVVAKLFGIAGPCRAFFGEKDWQQLEVVRRMTIDLSLPVEVVGCPIVREPDGLAMSSRNVYLSDSERESALALSRALEQGVSIVAGGEKDSATVCSAMLEAMSDVDTQYAAHVGPGMTSKDIVEPGDRLLVAAKVGPARLIDNVGVQ